MNGLPPLSGAILLSNPRGPTHMALALQNPRPGTLRRVAQYAKFSGQPISKALDIAGFKKGTPLKQRGLASAGGWWKNFFESGKKGGFKKKLDSGKFGAAGSRGGKVTARDIQAVRREYEARFGKIKAGSMKKARVLSKTPAGALREALITKAQAAFRKKHGGVALKAGFRKSPVYKKIMGATDTQLRSMAKTAGVAKILAQQEKRKGTKAKLRAHAEELRAAGKLWPTPAGPAKGKTRKSRGGSKSRKGKGARKPQVDVNWGEIEFPSMDAFANGRRRGKKARRNALALQNALALENALALQNNPGIVRAFAMEYALPLAAGGALGGGLHAVAVVSGGTEMLQEQLVKIPMVGETLAFRLPYTTQGVIVSVGLAVLSRFLPAGKIRATGIAAAASAITVGAGIDMLHYAEEQLPNYLPGGAPAVAFDETDPSAFGALALENRALGALALENGLGAYGDGMAWELGRLGQGDFGQSDYGQALMADAHFAGADFSPEEGEALMNGRDSWLGTYGAPPIRQEFHPGSASHLAGKPGHQWGWLVRTLGYNGARQVCMLPPRERVAVIAKLKGAALAAYQQMMLQQQAAEAQTIPSPEFSPAAGAAPMGAMGASGPGLGASYLGDPLVFQGA